MDVTTNSSQPSFTTTSHASQSSTTTAAAASPAFSLAIPQSSASFNPASSSFLNPPSLSQETASSNPGSSTLVDSNSPELFKQNIQIAMDQVARVGALARSASNGIQNAYQAGVSPVQTEADLTALDQAMHALADVLRQSGVGAYPFPGPARNASPPTEQQLIADTTHGVQQLYEEFKRMQESSAVVANLLAAPENLGRPKA